MKKKIVGLLVLCFLMCGYTYTYKTKVLETTVENDEIELDCTCTHITEFAGGGLSCNCRGDYKKIEKKIGVEDDG